MPSAAMEASLAKAHHRFDIWKEKKKTLKKYLIHTAVRWKLLQVQWPLIGRCSATQPLVHIVKGGETLTSISRYYGVSILQIAAENDNIVDIDFVQEGQRLNIPVHSETLLMVSAITVLTCNMLICTSFCPCAHRNVMSQISMAEHLTDGEVFQILNGPMRVRKFYPDYHPFVYYTSGQSHWLSSRSCSLIALCISFIIKTFHSRTMKKLKFQSTKGSQAPRHGLRTDSWRTVLDDPFVSDPFDTPSGGTSGDPSEEDHSPTCSRETYHEYSKHESAYLKFLKECGMSKWGYFRGGSPE